MTKIMTIDSVSYSTHDELEEVSINERKAHNAKLREMHCGKLAAQTFEMRYCKCCLKKYLQGVDIQDLEEYIGLKVPVIDDWGIVYLASIAVRLSEFLELLEGPQKNVDLSGYAILLKLEDMRQPDSSLH